MTRKGISLLLLVLLSLSALGARDVQLTTSFAYNPSVLSSWNYGGTVSGLYSDKNILATAGVRYQKDIFDLSYQFRYSFGGSTSTRYLIGNNIIETSSNPLFITLKGGFEYMPANGWENILSLQAGKILASTTGDFRAGASLAIGAYIHMSKAEGFRKVMVSFDPDGSFSLFCTLFGKLYADLSFISTMPFYYPKQISYGISFSLAYDICTWFTMGFSGYLFFTDLIGETEIPGRRELDLHATVRLPL